MIKIVQPDIKYKESFIKALSECRAYEGDDIEGLCARFSNITDEELSDFRSLVNDRLDIENGSNARFWGVPTSEFWVIDSKNEYVGYIDIRHKLKKSLYTKGGNINCFIIPSRRGGLYAYYAMFSALDFASSIGLKRVLILCDKHNYASRRGIEKLVELKGGERLLDYTKKNEVKQRYFINTK